MKEQENISKKGGELSPRVVKTIIRNYKSEKYLGYCQLQGVYLAAREAGEDNVKIFREAKRKYSNNIIPNF